MGKLRSGPGVGRRVWVGVALGMVVGLALSACQGTGGDAPTAEPVAQRLILQSDTVWGPTNIPEAERAGKVCVQKSTFARNEEIVWRTKVIDPATGEPMDDELLSSVKVIIADQTLDMRYGPHPRDTPADFFWTVAFNIPEDYPSGELPYTVEAVAADGRTGTFEQFAVTLARLTITEEVRPAISE